MPRSPRSVATDAVAVVLAVILVGYLAVTSAPLLQALATTALLVAGWALFRFAFVSASRG